MTDFVSNIQQDLESTGSAGEEIARRNKNAGSIGSLSYQPLQMEVSEHNPILVSTFSPNSDIINGLRNIDDDEEEASSPSWKDYFERRWTLNSIRTYIFVTLPFIIVIIALSIVIAHLRHHHHQSSSNSNSDTSSSTSWDAYSISSLRGVVATDTEICSQIGVNILNLGGNAVDAAIASKFCLGVISPASSGIGGGCYILIHNVSSNTQEFIDSREVAPAAANPLMFISDPMKAQDGGLAIAVLGEVKGLYTAFQRHGSGKVSWKQLVMPASLLASEWTVSPELYRLFSLAETQLLSGQYPELSNLYTKNNHQSFKSIGEIIRDPVLSNTLQRIAEEGPDYLYVTMAETLAQEIQAAGGIITADDIRRYEPIVSAPLKANISGYEYIGVGESSSGGPAMIGILKFMSTIPTPLISLGNNYFHYLIECFKHVFAIRSNLGDPAYVNVTNVYQAILSENYMEYLERERTSALHTYPLLNYGGLYNLQYLTKVDAGTTHLSVLDEAGNAVAMTSTINTYFGSKVISPSTGVLFNNQMDDFSIPNASNYFGLAPSPFNYPEPYKRPLSSMSPSILLDAYHQVRVIGGASGGPRIITATAQVMLNYLFKGMDLLSAVRAPRLHSQLLPDSVDVENNTLVSGLHIQAPDAILALLRERKHHNVSLKSVGMGVTQFIAVDPDSRLRVAVSDPRKDGKPAAQK